MGRLLYLICEVQSLDVELVDGAVVVPYLSGFGDIDAGHLAEHVPDSPVGEGVDVGVDKVAEGVAAAPYRLGGNGHFVELKSLIFGLEVGCDGGGQRDVPPGLADIEPRNHHPDGIGPEAVLEAVPTVTVRGREAVKCPAVSCLQHHIRPRDRLAGVGVRHAPCHDGMDQ